MGNELRACHQLQVWQCEFHPLRKVEGENQLYTLVLHTHASMCVVFVYMYVICEYKYSLYESTCAFLCCVYICVCLHVSYVCVLYMCYMHVLLYMYVYVCLCIVSSRCLCFGGGNDPWEPLF